MGRQVFGISCTRIEVKKILDECPLQFCTFSFVHREAAASDLVAQFKIYNIEFFSEVPVWNRCSFQRWHRSTLPDIQVFFRGFAWRNKRRWQVRQLNCSL